MRTSRAILLGSIAALALVTAPALAKTANTQSSETMPTSSGCTSSQQNADGSWTERPCQELGQPAPAPRKSAAGNGEQATHRREAN